MHVVVLGAGVIGLATAWCLSRDGHRVTLVERNRGVALETSYANGGQLSYSYVAPLASPSVLPKLPPWLLSADAPLRFRPQADLQQWRFCLAFLLACTQKQADLTTRQLLVLSFYSRMLTRELVERESLDFAYARSGKLVVHSDAATYASACRLLDYQASLGCEQQALDADACVALEPALAHMRPLLAGGIHTPSEDAGDCYLFCVGLERMLRAAGATFILGETVRRLRAEGGRVVAAETAQGAVEADAYVLATGNRSVPLAREVGIRLPMYPLKGYSLTVPIADDAGAPRVSVTDYGQKVVYARLGESLRVAGMAEIAGHDAEPDPRRVALLARQAASRFPGAGDYDGARAWCGLRPATPKGPPVLGATPYPNLMLNVGHGALGFTLAMGSAQVVADLVAGRQPAIPLDGFRLEPSR
jgi:D-amino-acid dehydrogenase